VSKRPELLLVETGDAEILEQEDGLEEIQLKLNEVEAMIKAC